MSSFEKSKKNLPLGAVWLMNSIAEYKGKQELYSKQSPQILKALVEMALMGKVTAPKVTLEKLTKGEKLSKKFLELALKELKFVTVLLRKIR